MINPYKNVKWESVEYIKSMSHMHATNQERFERAINAGYRHIAVTNYQPSVPTYPLSDFFTNIPEGVIGCPNTEKVYTLNNSVHFCSLGSFAVGHGHTEGKTATWQQAFSEIIEQLQFPDGGGITLNHPSSGDLEKYAECLDFDDRVLGIEIFNSCGRKIEGKYHPRYYTEFWDRVLSSGRRCWGFAVVDWMLQPENLGSNVLLVPAATEHECLKAYRDGCYYMMIKDRGLRFTNLQFNDNKLDVAVNKDSEIKFITSRGEVKTVNGTSATCEVSDSDMYIRVEARELGDPDSHILSNPIIFFK